MIIVWKYKQQLDKELSKKKAWGESRNKQKNIEIDTGKTDSNGNIIYTTESASKIYSQETYNTYFNRCCSFFKWVEEKYPGTKQINQCHRYVPEYLEEMIEKHESNGIFGDEVISAWTISTARSALAKLYNQSERYIRLPRRDGKKDKDGKVLTYKKTLQPFNIDVPTRKRDEIKRSRVKNTVSSKHFSEKKNQDLVDFLRATGLRRCEVTKCTGSWISKEDGHLYVNIPSGIAKGGKPRKTLILSDNEIKQKIWIIAQEKQNDVMYEKVPQKAPIHQYRKEYADELRGKYTIQINAKLGEPTKDERITKEMIEKLGLDPEEKYIKDKIIGQKRLCVLQKDKAGEEVDRIAALMVARNLGHNRIDVANDNY